MFLTEKYHLYSLFPSKIGAAKKLDLISDSFDEALLRRLKALSPPQSAIDLSWLSLAADVLTFVYGEAGTLITNLKLSSTNEDSLALFLDESVKVLDLCNSISSEIERIRHRRLLLKFGVELLAKPESQECLDADKLRQAKDALFGLRMNDDSARIKKHGFAANFEDLVRDLFSRLENAPRGKISSAGSLVRRTIHAVGLVTILIAGVLVAALRGSEELFVAVRAPADYLWADCFNGLQTAISAEFTREFSGDDEKKRNYRIVKEFADVEARVREISSVIDGMLSGESDKMKEEKLNGAAKELEKLTDVWAEGLDRLSNGVNGVFNMVMSTRKEMLEKTREGVGAAKKINLKKEDKVK